MRSGSNESTGHRVAISAHRGGQESAPPDTWEAYEKSVDTGAEYVEFDVRRTADGQLVCFHDEHVKPGGRPLAAISYDELREALGYDVPIVSDVMKLIAGKVIGHVDIKHIGHEAETVGLALDILGVDGFIATTLEDSSVRAIKDYAPRVRTALSLGREVAGRSPWEQLRIRVSELFPLDRIRACGADWVAVDHRLARYRVLDVCHRHGIGVMVWTVNEDRLIRRFLADRRAAVLITDRPRHAVTIREASSGGIS